MDDEKPGGDNIDFACLDFGRLKRTGLPEVIFCKGKSLEQIVTIAKTTYKAGENIIGTKADLPVYQELKKVIPEIRYNEMGRIFHLKQKETEKISGVVSIITAGTADIPVAEEAAETLDFFRINVKKYYDIGVAGVHRILNRLDEIRSSDVIIAIAGMEGALPSVVGGQVDCPIIAVPTSTGYGASFGGLSALLGMINSCVPGITVVNIDNGFGAAAAAVSILRKINKNDK
ncbi:MAG: nickel pincer cofactor biosynthesis protein LarB [Actinobacteria bacterium]|nr:nickel pincer cofactor biosynthesis protein LarB [Actinomycetota bacterium]